METRGKPFTRFFRPSIPAGLSADMTVQQIKFGKRARNTCDESYRRKVPAPSHATRPLTWLRRSPEDPDLADMEVMIWSHPLRVGSTTI